MVNIEQKLLNLELNGLEKLEEHIEECKEAYAYDDKYDQYKEHPDLYY